MKKRTAFTLVELLVVIAIIATLVGMLLPAVQSARESGRRATCANRLKQVATALQTYHQAHNALPAGVGNARPFNPDVRRDEDSLLGCPDTWAAMILPQLELSVIFDRLLMTQNAGHATNAPLVAIPVPVMVCPSEDDAENPVLRDRCDVSSRNPVMMGGSYCASLGPNSFWGTCTFCPSNSPSATNPCCNESRSAYPDPLDTVPPIGNRGTTLGNYASGPGMFNVGAQRVPFSDVRDGLSNTALLGEFISGDSIHAGMYLSNFNTVAFNIPVNRYALPRDTPATYHNPLDNNRENDRRNSGIKSRHPGGAHIALCDGSVRLLDEIIDLRVLTAIGSRKLGASGGEAQSFPW
jgi:prepilin-type N-terminal cleavage/methylation domain-containing protein/prepilin-type processing-associated H-X9-DG protein